MNTPDSIQWSEFNQQHLVNEFSRLKHKFTGSESVNQENYSVHQQFESFPSAIDTLCQAFSLSDFEKDVLLLCAAVEKDSQLAELCATHHENTQKNWPSMELAFDLLDNAHWSAITPEAPLRRYQLIHLEETGRLLSSKLRIDERVLHFLSGINYLEPRLKAILLWVKTPSIIAPSQMIIAESIQAFMQNNPDIPVTCLLSGNDASGKKDIAVASAQASGMTVFELSHNNIPDAVSDQEVFAILWQREMVLLNAVLFIDCEESDKLEKLSYFIERLGGVCFVAAGKSLSSLQHQIRFRINKPDAIEQRLLWRSCLEENVNLVHKVLDTVASQFLFSSEQIRTSSPQLINKLNTANDSDACFWQHCRELDQTRLGNLGQFVPVKAGWQDLILPEQEMFALQQIVAHVRQKLRVYHDWGFAEKSHRGLGISVLFSGESGTGKTMAAEVLAKALNLDLYRVDLSTVVSKYIGETEKNLSKIFDSAENNGVILLFDEADALFGKRSEVKDSHDRYANLEVSYLLQRMEAFQGLAILTTNLKSALDKAFLRRIRFVVQFPFPDQYQRERIWQQIFPENTPLKNLNFSKLGRLNMAGGNIRNIALNAAFFAADAGEAVNMLHLAQAAHIEAAKREQSLSEAETRGWL